MKVFALAATATFATLSVVHSAEQSSLHLRIHNKGGACTIANESQCDGQSWTESTCCADSNYECRWSGDRQDMKRCQKKRSKGQHHKDVEDDSDDDSDFDIDIDTDDVASAFGIRLDDYDDSSDYDDYSDWFGDDDSSDSKDGDSSDSKDEISKHRR
ncbi:hypothetical protein PInf_017356 [Phytophthora infestans]|nr:hypothetical protein PInf_017356 [Phytophthora infestans]